MRVVFWREKKMSATMRRRSERKNYSTRSSRGVASNENDAPNSSSAKKSDASTLKPNSRLSKQLQIDMCIEQILPRAHLDSSINTHDEQYNLRHRISEPNATTVQQHVNKRKLKGQVRLFGECDLNPNLRMKSTRSFFLEARLDSPIHKLIEINKQAMLDFQEPTTAPAATTTEQIDNRFNQSNNKKPFTYEKSQNRAITPTNDEILVTTVCGPRDSIESESSNGSVDYDDKIVAFRMPHIVNKSINAANVVPVVEKVVGGSDNAMELDSCSQLNELEEHELIFEGHSEGEDGSQNCEELKKIYWENCSGYNEDELIIIDDDSKDGDESQEKAETKKKKTISRKNSLDCSELKAPLDMIEPMEVELSENVDLEMSHEISGSDKSAETESTEMSSNETSVEASVATAIEATAVEATVVEANAIETTRLDEENLESPRAGQLVWAQMSKYPFWPAVVQPDRDGITTSDKGVLVMFLADNKRCAWIKSRKSLLPYTGQGLQEFENHRQRVLNDTELNKTDRRNATIFFKLNYSKAWSLAVVECDILAHVSIEHRLDFYKKILIDFPKSKNPIDDTISISSSSTISELGKSSSPCTFDTAYSSMKPSSSSSVSMISHSTCSSSNRMFDEYDDEVMQQGPPGTNETIIRDERIECFFNSISQPNVSGAVAQNPHAIQQEQHDQLETVDIKYPLAVYDACITKTSLQAQKMHESIMEIFKENIIIEGRENEFFEAISTYREQQTVKTVSTSKRKRTKTSTAVESAKKMKPEPAKLTARTKARASRSLVPSKPVAPPAPDPQVAKKLQEEKEKAKQERLLKRKEQFFEYAVQKYPASYLFKKLPEGLVCQICLKPDNVHECSGKCSGYFHRECLAKERANIGTDWYDALMERTCSEAATIDLVTGDDFVEPSILCRNAPPSSINADRFECATCSGDRKPKCFVCSAETGEPVRCSRKGCRCYFHVDCLKYWPQHQLKRVRDSVKSLMCPRHVCQTCIADHPHRNYASNIESDQKLIKCLLCPATYHHKSICIPAGSELLSQTQMVCPRHRVSIKKPVNTDWCFLCGKGGSLICCETCPTAFHQICLDIPQPDDKYICEECESGRLPLYGETVWVKYGSCKWWPGVLVDPFNVPKNVAEKKIGPNHMAVRFFGTYDFGWVCQGFIYLYQIEDTNFSKFKDNDKRYSVAVQEASEFTKEIKAKYGERKVIRHRPQYIRIHVNRPVPPVKFDADEDLEENICGCSPDDVDPCGPANVKSCVNYAMQYECNGHCPAKEKCQNQRFAKRQYPKLQLKLFESKGWGLIALENIKCNTFIIEYVGEVIDSDEFHRRFQQSVRDKAENFYFLRIENGLYIDSGIRGNDARFINHSCEPNCDPQKWTVDGQTRIGLFASQDIPMNTELTFNYNWDTISIQRCVCHCGTKTCSGYIGFKAKFNKKS